MQSAPRVLLVEAAGTTARALARLLVDEGVARDVVVGPDAATAQAHLRAGDVDMIVLDLALPDRQSLTLLEQIRATPETHLLPIVVLSGSTDAEVMERSYDLGANCFVRKPQRVVELLPAVRAIGRFWKRHAARPGRVWDETVLELPLAPTADAVREARATVRRLLEVWGLGSIGETAELCASELATNAVIHARSPVRLMVALLPAAVRVEVEDEAPGEIEAGTLVHDEETGRGLAIVDTMSECWGVEQHGDGKTVWFELRRPDVA